MQAYMETVSKCHGLGEWQYFLTVLHVSSSVFVLALISLVESTEHSLQLPTAISSVSSAAITPASRVQTRFSLSLSPACLTTENIWIGSFSYSPGPSRPHLLFSWRVEVHIVCVPPPTDNVSDHRLSPLHFFAKFFILSQNSYLTVFISIY